MSLTANRVSKEVRKIIDDFWSGRCTRDEAKKKIEKIMDDPKLRIKIMRGENYTSVFENILGKKRIAEFEGLTK